MLATITFPFTPPTPRDYDTLSLIIGDEFEGFCTDIRNAATKAKLDGNHRLMDSLHDFMFDFIAEYERTDCFTSYGLIATYRAKLREIAGK